MSPILDYFETKLTPVFSWYDGVSERWPRLATMGLLAGSFAVVALVFLFLLNAFSSYSRTLAESFPSLRGFIPELSVGDHILGFSLLAALFSVLVLGSTLYRYVKAVNKLFVLRSWCNAHGCASVANTVTEQQGQLLHGWTVILKKAVDYEDKPSEGWARVVTSLMLSYLGSLAAQQANKPGRGSANVLLPTHFGPYAKGVEEIVQDLAGYCVEKGDIRVAIRTLLTRDVPGWFNILRLLLPCKSRSLGSGTMILHHTAPWWEHYKRQIHNNKLKGSQIALHRLVCLPESDMIDGQKAYLRLGFDPAIGYGRDCLCAREFVEARTKLERLVGQGKITWAGGLDGISLDEAPFLSDIQLHPICHIDDLSVRNQLSSWSDYTYRLTSAFSAFMASHETIDPPSGKPESPGAWAKFLGKNQSTGMDYVHNYDDLFIIDFLRGQTLVGRAGISFRLEPETTVSGIALLPSRDLEDAVNQFDLAWSTARAS